MTRKKWVVLLAGATLLTACRVGPDYKGPSNRDGELPGMFGQIDDPAFVAGETDLRTWWTVFDDSLLNELIDKAAQDNKDLRIALSRVNEARARVSIAQAARAPQVTLGGGVSGVSDAGTGFETRTRTNIGLDASWELDVFGRIARQIESVDAEYAATEEDRRDVQVSLFAEVARAYLSVRSLQAQLSAAENNIKSQREILRLTETRFRDGLSSGLDVAQARQVLASSEAAVPPLRIALSREVNTIAVLVGTHPQALHVDLRDPKPIPVPPTTVTVGVPVYLLRQRPDIRAAERRLASQTAQLGVATADLYPSFSIAGSFGLSAFDGTSLLDPSSRSFALGPGVRWNIFDGGRLRAQIQVEDAKVEQTLLLYERAVLSAMEEVESSMTAFIEQRIRVEAIERAAEASRETLKLATRLYSEGLTGFQDVLDAQRQLLASESDVAEARGLASQNLVSLYKAFGGGWDPEEVSKERPHE